MEMATIKPKPSISLAKLKTYQSESGQTGSTKPEATKPKAAKPKAAKLEAAKGLSLLA